MENLNMDLVRRESFSSLWQRAIPYLVGATSLSVLLFIPVLASAFHQLHVLEQRSQQLSPALQEINRTIASVQSRPGPQGASGMKGSSGAKGVAGVPGEQGQAGRQGPGGKGAPGRDGSAGLPGSPGVPGAKGDTGPLGPFGPRGAAGLPGARGATGEPGPLGAKGSMGQPASPGSALNETTGPGAQGQGAPGPPGPSGLPGAEGPPGVEGSPGLPGPVGPPGTRGETGELGPQGLEGPEGPQGDQGPVGEASKTNAFEWTHPNGTKHQQFKFKIECLGNCRFLSIHINHQDGDVDLYGREGEMPAITNNNCRAQQCSCRSRTSTTRDSCDLSSTVSNLFFIVLIVDKPHVDLVLDIMGFNMFNVTGPI